MKILVTGATASIGLKVIEQLLEKGYEVKILTRQKTISPVLKKTEIWTSDLTDITKEIVNGIDIVIHIAAATPNTNPEAETYRKINVDGTKHLVSVCEENNVSGFVFISSTVVLYDNTDAYSLSKKQAEIIIVNSKLNWTILRPSEIIGADKSLERFIDILRNKKNVFVPGSGRQFRHPVYYLDVANAIIQVINNKKTYRKKYILAASKPVTYYNYLSVIKKLFNLNFKIWVIPLWIIKLMSAMKIILPGNVKRKIQNAHNMLRSFNYDIQNCIDDFGYNPVDIETGFSEIAKETKSS